MDTEAIRAWAAGFVDAKAYILVEPRNLRVTIKRKDKMVLEWLERHFGGNVHLQRDGTHIWNVCGDTARKFAQDISPYVVVKVDEIERIAKQPLTGRRRKKRGKLPPKIA